MVQRDRERSRSAPLSFQVRQEGRERPRQLEDGGRRHRRRGLGDGRPRAVTQQDAEPGRKLSRSILINTFHQMKSSPMRITLYKQT